MRIVNRQMRRQHVPMARSLCGYFEGLAVTLHDGPRRGHLPSNAGLHAVIREATPGASVWYEESPLITLGMRIDPN